MSVWINFLLIKKYGLGCGWGEKQRKGGGEGEYLGKAGECMCSTVETEP